MRAPALLAALLAIAGCDNSVDIAIPDATATPPGWSLVWSDEFDGRAVDESKWSFELGDGCPDLCGWGNAELQAYTRENVSVGDGVLTIQAREAEDGGYTSGRLRTLGKGDWTYGRFEIRARLPTGQGLWPAIWMFFSDDTYGGWAASGEIDIMEAIGSEPDEVFGTLHYGGPFPDNVFSGENFQLAAGDFSDDFFVFIVEWDEAVPDDPDTPDVDEAIPTTIRWYVNNVLFSTKTSDDWYTTGSDDPAAPFDHPFHLLLNVAVGGNLPGSPDETTTFPQAMVVDYVRVYQRDA